MFNYFGRVAALFSLLLAAGCGTLPPGESVPVEMDPEYTEVERPQPPVTPPSPSAPEPQSPVTDAAQTLIDKAARASSSGNYEQAIALLERALRIGPDKPEVYLSMAQTYSAKGDTSMASATAERGMMYCSGTVQCAALRAFTH